MLSHAAAAAAAASSSPLQLLLAMMMDTATAAPHSAVADESRTAPAVKQDESELVHPNLQSKTNDCGNTLWDHQVDALMNLVKLTPQVSTCPYTLHSTLARLRASYTSSLPATVGGFAATDCMASPSASAPAGVPQSAVMRKGDPATSRARDLADESRAAPAGKRKESGPVGATSAGKKRRRNYGGLVLSPDQVEAFMDEEHNLKARPLVLDSVSMAQATCGGWIFKEKGKVTRPSDPRADKWRRGGGAGEATDLPNASVPRVRRRYGYVIPARNESPRLRYHQYCRLLPTQKDGEQSSSLTEDSQTWLYHVLPPVWLTPPAQVIDSPTTPAPVSQGSTGLGSTKPVRPDAGSPPEPLGIAKDLLAALNGDFSKAVECLLTAHKFG